MAKRGRRREKSCEFGYSEEHVKYAKKVVAHFGFRHNDSLLGLNPCYHCEIFYDCHKQKEA